MTGETITTILISAFSSGMISTVLVKAMDIRHDNKLRKKERENKEIEKKEKKKADYYDEKRQVYIQALKRLSEIRTGFDYTAYDDIPKTLENSINNLNENAAEFSAMLRLYSSDEIYNLYWDLVQWNRFAYVRNSNSWRLFEKSKEIFSINTTYLARLMQDDLGYRDYVANPEKIECPQCHRKHDVYKTCKCGLTWNQTMEETRQALRDEMESRQKDLFGRKQSKES